MVGRRKVGPEDSLSLLGRGQRQAPGTEEANNYFGPQDPGKVRVTVTNAPAWLERGKERAGA